MMITSLLTITTESAVESAHLPLYQLHKNWRGLDNEDDDDRDNSDEISGNDGKLGW